MNTFFFKKINPIYNITFRYFCEVVFEMNCKTKKATGHDRFE